MMVAPRSVGYDVYLRDLWKEPGVTAFIFVFRRLLNASGNRLLLAAAAIAVALFAAAIVPGRARANEPHPRWGAGGFDVASSAQTAGADDPIQMAVDMDPSSPPTVDSAATITVPEPFKVGINVTSVAPGTLYRGYQVEVQFPNDALEFVSATPASSSPLQLCQAANDVFSADNSVEFVQDGCAKSSAGGVDYVEEVELMTFKCTSDGTFTIHMTTLTEDTAFGTAALDQNSAFIPTGTADGTVTCLGVAPPPACPAAPDFSFSVDDPTGDAFFGFGSGPVLHDITSVSGAGDAATLCLTVDFAGPVAPADARSTQSVLGYIDFDTDANSGTGSP